MLKTNKYGIIDDRQEKKRFTPTVPGGKHFLVNREGFIAAHKDQKGWRIQCANVGNLGAYLISAGKSLWHINKNNYTSLDVEITGNQTVFVEQEGMLSTDWTPITVTRVT